MSTGKDSAQNPEGGDRGLKKLQDERHVVIDVDYENVEFSSGNMNGTAFESNNGSVHLILFMLRTWYYLFDVVCSGFGP